MTAGEADFGLALSPVQLPGLSVRTLGGSRMVCIAPTGHPLLARETVTPADLDPFPLISFGSETHFGQLLDQAFERGGARRRVGLQVTSSIVAASYVQRAIGVALVDSFTLNAGLSGFDWRPFTPAVVLPVTVMSQGNHLLSRHATALIRSIELTVQAWTGAPSARRRKPN